LGVFLCFVCSHFSNEGKLISNAIKFERDTAKTSNSTLNFHKFDTFFPPQMMAAQKEAKESGGLDKTQTGLAEQKSIFNGIMTQIQSLTK
jgi:hypothetical protein